MELLGLKTISWPSHQKLNRLELFLKNKTFNKKNSALPSNIITQITNDEYNRVWIGTTKGVVSFDGEKWKTYKIQKKPQTIFNIYIDEQDNKWISTEQALIVYNEEGVSEVKTKKNSFLPYFKVKNNSEIEYFLSSTTNVEMKIYNNQGEIVETLIMQKMF